MLLTMNKEEMTGRVLSWHTAIASGHEPALYTYIGSEVPLGEYEAILDFKIWAKKTIGISCYFTQVQTSKKFQLTVYCNFQTGSYKISGCDIDFAVCPINRKYQIGVLLHAKGRTVFARAILK